MADASTANVNVSLGGRYFKPLTPGAGRFLDYAWPPLSNFVSAGVMSSRPGSSAAVSTASQSFGGGTADTVTGTSGLPAISINSSAVVGNGDGKTWPGARVLLNTTKNAVDASANDMAVWRVIYNVANSVIPAASGEVGCYLICDPGLTRLVTSAGSGFGFRWLNDGSLVWTVVVGGVPTNTQVLAVAGLTVFHSLEIRMYAATASADAFLEVYVDTVRKIIPKASSSWAAGSILPGIAASTAASLTIGFLPSMCNMANVANGFLINQVRVIAGPTLAACL